MLVTADVFDWTYHALRWTWHDPDGYNFISGPLADITLLGGAFALLRHHNCHVKGCLRLARHPVAGTDYIVCRRHHPHGSPSAEQVLAEHRAAKHAAAAASVAAQEVAAAAPHEPPAVPPAS